MPNIEPTADNLFQAHTLQYLRVKGKPEQSRRPKLLFLARPFPPLKATACVRTWNIAKYLARLGWDVTVVTPHPSVWRNVEDQKEANAALARDGIQLILTGHQWRCLEVDNLDHHQNGVSWFLGGICRKLARCLHIEKSIGWIKPAELACEKLISRDVDVILATASPFITFRLAKRLADKLSCPYVLDYRDPWAGNPHAVRQPRLATIQEEASLLADSAGVTIVSPSWGVAMDRRFGLGSKLHIVSNGYDPEEVAHIEPHDFNHFAIVYAGNFYPPKRVVSPLMAALRRLKENVKLHGIDWKFHYYGKDEDHVLGEAKRFGVVDKILLHGMVPRGQALSAIRGAGVTVVVTSVTPEVSLEDKGILTGKLFESLAVGKPILLIAPPGSDAEGIIESTDLIQRFAGNEHDAIASFLTRAIQGWTPMCTACEEYAWPSIIKKLDGVLREAMHDTSPKQRLSQAAFN